MFKPGIPRSRKRLLLENLFTATVYFILGKLSLMLQFQFSNATPVWPPSGFAFAMMLLIGYRIFPGIMLGALAVNVTIFLSNKTSAFPASLFLSFIISIGNTAETLTGYFLLKKLLGSSLSKNFFTNLNHIFLFCFAALAMCLASCTIGTTANFLAGIVQPGQYFMVWLTWWLGDASGILLATPFIVIFVSSIKESSLNLKAGWKKNTEVFLFFLLTIVTSGIVFDNWFFNFFIFQWAFWLIPVLTWAALRFGQRETITGLVICSIIATWGTINHHGPFAVNSLNQSLLTVQGFISIITITQLALNAAVIERKRTETALREARSHLEVKVQERTAELSHAAVQLEEQKSFAELLIESSPDMLAAYDRQLNITAWNKKSEEHTGLTKEQVLGKYMFELFPEYNNKKWLKIIDEVFAGKALHYPKIKFERMQGWGENFLIPLLSSKRDIIGLLSMTRDITQLVTITNALEQKNQQLERMNHELASFSYIASHDLQEPLRKIQMFAKRILETESGVLSDAGKDYFLRMQHAAERMQRLIEDLLSYSRTNTSEEYFEKTNLNLLLANVKADLKEKISETSAFIEIADLPEVTVIPFQFQQLFTNLISNSLKFANPQTPLHIVITTEIVHGNEIPDSKFPVEKKYHRFIITDNGIGFEPEYNKKIFELFQRLHSRSEYEGTGIGLAICKKIVDNHDGIITAQGEPGKGARFDIYVPV